MVSTGEPTRVREVGSESEMRSRLSVLEPALTDSSHEPHTATAPWGKREGHQHSMALQGAWSLGGISTPICIQRYDKQDMLKQRDLCSPI